MNAGAQWAEITSTPRTLETLDLTANRVGKARREVLDGRSYLVVPFTSIVPGVLNGSKGRLYYPPDQIARNVSDWDEMPLVVRHPVRNGVHVTAHDLDVLDVQGVGFTKSHRYDGGLKGEAWFDVQKSDAVDPRIVRNLEAGLKVELSTGLFTDNVEVPPGTRTPKGAEYDFEARNYVPDHLAVLPDEVGACSVNDGCGFLVNRLSEHDWRPVGNAKDDLTGGRWVTTDDGNHVYMMGGELVAGNPEVVKAMKGGDGKEETPKPKKGTEKGEGKKVPQSSGTATSDKEVSSPKQVKKDEVVAVSSTEARGEMAKKPRGEWTENDADRMGKPKTDGDLNMCFENARKEYLAQKAAGKDPVYVVGKLTAYQKGVPAHGGPSVEIDHAWVEVDGKVVDPSPFRRSRLSLTDRSTEPAEDHWDHALYVADRYAKGSALSKPLDDFPDGTPARKVEKALTKRTENALNTNCQCGGTCGRCEPRWVSVNADAPSDALDITPEKACLILKDGEVHGKPLTEAQRGMFGAKCGERKKPTGNEWLSVNANPEGCNQYTGPGCGGGTASDIHGAYEGAASLTDKHHEEINAVVDKASKEELLVAIKKMGFFHKPSESKTKIAEAVKSYIARRRGSIQRVRLIDRDIKKSSTRNSADDDWQEVGVANWCNQYGGTTCRDKGGAGTKAEPGDGSGGGGRTSKGKAADRGKTPPQKEADSKTAADAAMKASQKTKTTGLSNEGHTAAKDANAASKKAEKSGSADDHRAAASAHRRAEDAHKNRAGHGSDEYRAKHEAAARAHREAAIEHHAAAYRISSKKGATRNANWSPLDDLRNGGTDGTPVDGWFEVNYNPRGCNQHTGPGCGGGGGKTDPEVGDESGRGVKESRAEKGARLKEAVRSAKEEKDKAHAELVKHHEAVKTLRSDVKKQGVLGARAATKAALKMTEGQAEMARRRFDRADAAHEDAKNAHAEHTGQATKTRTTDVKAKLDAATVHHENTAQVVSDKQRTVDEAEKADKAAGYFGSIKTSRVLSRAKADLASAQAEHEKAKTDLKAAQTEHDAQVSTGRGAAAKAAKLRLAESERDQPGSEKTVHELKGTVKSLQRHLASLEVEMAKAKGGDKAKLKKAHAAAKKEARAAMQHLLDLGGSLEGNAKKKPGGWVEVNQSAGDGWQSVVNCPGEMSDMVTGPSDYGSPSQDDGSLGGQILAVRRAFRDAHPTEYDPKTGTPKAYCSVVSVFDDYLVYSESGPEGTELYRQSYSVGDDGDVEIADDSEPVRRVVSYETVKAGSAAY